MERCVSRPQQAHTDRALVSAARVLPVLERHWSCALQSYDEAMMAQWGVEHHPMQEDQDPSSKRPRTERTATDAAAYTSRSIGLSGFLRYQPQGPIHGWWLCDEDVQVQVQLLEPRPCQLESKVLVQAWTYCYGGPIVGAFLEVHAEPLVLEPREAQLSIDHVRAVLAVHYPTRDPPLYSSRVSWRQAVHADALHREAKGKQQRRSHCVLGLVVSVSPVAQPKDHDGCHYFVEIEWADQATQTQSVVNVMFTGIRTVQWHPCLIAGKMALMTDLVKVYSQDCGIFLLQSTASASPDDNEDSLTTQVMTWNLPEVMVPKLSLSVEGGVDLEGRVTGVRWDAWLELDGCEHRSVLVSLLHVPLTDTLQRLRKGTVVRIWRAHLLREPLLKSGEQRLVLGLCPRSSLVVVHHTEPSNPLVLASVSDQRLRKKWGYIGDVRRQPLPLSLRLLELYDALGCKFFLGLDALERNAPSYLSFRYTRKRGLVRTLVDLLGVQLAQFRAKKETLGSRFLKDHSAGMIQCPSMNLRTSPVGSRLVTLQELCDIGLRALEQAPTDSTPSARVPAHDLQGYLLVGSIRGNVSSGDLQICDRTGSVALVLQENQDAAVGNDLMESVADMCLYLVRRYELLVERIDQSSAQMSHKTLPVVVVSIICGVESLQVVPMTRDIPKSQESVEESDHGDAHVLFVTQIDPLDNPPVSGSGMRPRASYRHLHGIAFPERIIHSEGCSGELQASMYAAEVMVNDTTCAHWYVEKYGYYRLTQVTLGDEELKEEAGAGLAVTVLETMEQKCIGMLATFQDQHSLGSSDETLETMLQNFRCADSSGTESIRLRVWSLEPPCQIVPLAFDSSRDQTVFVQCDRDGLLRFPVVSDANSSEVEDIQLLIKRESIEISHKSLILCSLLRHFACQMQQVCHVEQFLMHPVSDSKAISDIHKARLVSFVGVVTERKYFWKAQKAAAVAQESATVGGKRPLQASNWVQAPTLMCSCRIRDLRSMNAINVSINVSRFSGGATLVPDSIVEASMLQSFIARSNYKVYTNWCHRSAVRRMRATIPVLPTPQLHALLVSTHLSQLYSSSAIDKRLHRWVVRVVHITYVLLKRRCRTCYQSLKFVKRQALWYHAVSPPTAGPKNPERCSWQRMKVSDPRFDASTFLATTVRCIIDDGSAQAELFLENDVAWELLQCSVGQRQRFIEMLRTQVAEISFFTGHASATNYFAPDAHSALDAYCQNELRFMVMRAMPRLRSIVVLGQRFYSSSKNKEPRATTTSSVLTFGKGVHLTTKTAANVQLEARRIDLLHVHSGIRELLQRNRS